MGKERRSGGGGVRFDGATLALSGELNTTKNTTLTQEITLAERGGGVRLASDMAATISGKITGSGDFWLSYDSGSLTLSNTANDYAGKTIIGSTTNQRSGGTAELRLGASNVLPDTTVVEFGTRTNSNKLEMQGHSDTVAGIAGLGAISNSGGPSTLTVDIPESAPNRVATLTLGENVVLKKTGAGVASLSASGPGTLELAGGMVHALGLLTPQSIHVTGDTTISTQALFGKTVFTGNAAFADALAPTGFQDNVTQEFDTKYDNETAARAGGTASNTTTAMSIYVDVLEDTKVSFYKNYDDNAGVWLTPVKPDGTLGTRKQYLLHKGWDVVICSEVFSLGAGQYLLDVRAGQGGGGAGPTIDDAIGMGIRFADTVGESHADFQAFTLGTDGRIGVDGNGYSPMMATTILGSANSEISIDANKTLTLENTGGGGIVVQGSVSGDGALVVSNPTGSVSLQCANTHKGGTTIRAKELKIAESGVFGEGDVTFTGPTSVVLAPIIDPADFHLAWEGGSLVGETSMNKTDDPASWTRTADPTYTHTGPGANTTWVYRAPLTALDDIELHFAEHFDDAVYIAITDITDSTLSRTGVLDVNAWNVESQGTFQFVKDHNYQLEVRTFNGGGGGGPTTSPASTLGLGALGCAMSVDGGTTWANLIFNDDAELVPGLLVRTPLPIPDAAVIPNNLALADAVTFDGNGRELTFSGKITGAGTLSLVRGDYALTHAENAVGGLSLEDAKYTLNSTTGFVDIRGDLAITDSVIHVDLTGYVPGATLNDGWLEVSGAVDLQNVTFQFIGNPAELTQALEITLIDAPESVLAEAYDGAVFQSLTEGMVALSTYENGNLVLLLGTPNSLPEPGTWLLMVLCLGVYVLRRRRR